MKNILRISGASLFYLSIMLLNSCKKEEVPALTTTIITNLLGTSATGGGSITSEGTGTVLSRGVCWSTGTSPTIGDNKTSDGVGAGSYTSSITGLNGATVYYIRAYATNSVGTGYGMAISFTTLGTAPTSTGAAATNITVASATLNGTINANYLSTVVSFEYGTTTSYGSIVTPSQSPITGSAVTIVSSDITGLTAATIYHFRIKSVNSLGATYSNDLIFTTLGLVPTVTSAAATGITSTGVTLNGTVNANYISSVVTFDHGTTTSYGSTATASQSPVTGNIVTNVSAAITGLTAGTIYHFRIKSVNSLGTSYGNDITFTTTAIVSGAPTIGTATAGNAQATITFTAPANNGGSAITGYTVTSSPGSITATGTASPITVTGLTNGTTYTFVVTATNAMGNSLASATSNSVTPLLTDIDGNVYNIVTIGTQVWMAENLKTTKYNDGIAIPNITDNTAWTTLTIGAYSWYNNDVTNKNTYGALYNWYSVDNNASTKTASNGGKNVCPSGWHVPTDAEWTVLTYYLTNNMYGYGGYGSNISKSMASTSGWKAYTTPGTIGNDQASNNSSGFAALPGGFHNGDGTYDYVGGFGYWWSSTGYTTMGAYSLSLYYYYSGVYRISIDKRSGMSVRCLRD